MAKSVGGHLLGTTNPDSWRYRLCRPQRGGEGVPIGEADPCCHGDRHHHEHDQPDQSRTGKQPPEPWLPAIEPGPVRSAAPQSLLSPHLRGDGNLDRRRIDTGFHSPLLSGSRGTPPGSPYSDGQLRMSSPANVVSSINSSTVPSPSTIALARSLKVSITGWKPGLNPQRWA